MRFPLLPCAVALCGWVSAAPAISADTPPTRKVTAAVTPAPLPPAAAEAAVKASAPDARGRVPGRAAEAEAPAASAAAQDPMERLRLRLAEKLAATEAARNPNVLRVVTRPSADERPAAPVRATKPRAAVNTQGPGPASGLGGKRGVALADWSYEGPNGPDRWAQLRPEYAACGNGTRQSPIDIRDGIGVELEPVRFDYRPSAFKVIDNGHTVQVNLAPGNSIELIGRRYELQQFHFHRPSEERINGRQFDMVAHLVHKDAEGRLAKVAVLLDRGSPQPVVQTVWNNLPLEKGEEQPGAGVLDPAALLPSDRSYYTYMGSLTTPPCTEGVLWVVMKQPVGIAPDQIGVFARLYPMNARPLQPASGRLIKGPK